MIFEAINIFGVKVIGEVKAIRNYTVILRDFHGVCHVVRKENLTKSLIWGPVIDRSPMHLGQFNKEHTEKVGYNPY